MSTFDPSMLEESSCGDVEMAEELVALFLEDVRAIIDGIDQALSQSEAHTLAKLAHTGKGSTRTMGGVTLGDSFAQLETFAKSGDLAGAATLLEPISLGLAQLESQFRMYLHNAA